MKRYASRQPVRRAVAAAILAFSLAACADSPESLLVKAKESLAKKETKEAEIHLKNLLQKQDIAEARYLLGKVYLDAGDSRSAEKELQRALDAIEQHDWPGNVRELENSIKRAVIMSEGSAITANDLGLKTDEDPLSFNLRMVRDEAEKQAVLKVMARVDGNIAKAAELLGISRPTLYDLLNRFGLR